MAGALTYPSDYVAVSTETTGFHAWTDDIILISALKITAGSRSRRRYRTLVKPRRKLGKFVAAITGITQRELDRKGKPLKQALEEFFRFAGSRRIVIFNADFDLPFWKAAAARCGMTMPKRVTCSLKLARKAWPGLKRHGIGHLVALVPAVRRRARRRRTDCAREAAVYEAAAAKLLLRD